MATTTFTPVERTMSLYPSEVADATKKLAKLNKRLAKLGAPAATLTVGPAEEKSEKDPLTGWTRVWTEHEVTLVGVEARHSGWTAIASLDHTVSDTEAWVSLFPNAIEEEVEIPAEYRTAGPVCDHCGLDRRRNVTSLWRHEDGRWFALGSGCVLEYLGVDPKTALWLAGANGNLDPDNEGRAPEYRPSVVEFLAVADMMVEEFGFVKSRPDEFGGRPTRDAAASFLAGRWNKSDREAFTGLDRRRRSRQGARRLGRSPRQRLGLLALGEARRRHRVGAPPHHGHPRLPSRCEAPGGRRGRRGRAAKAAEVPSFHIGSVKERMHGLPVTITGAFKVETMYGTSMRVNGVVNSGEFAGAKVGTLRFRLGALRSRLRDAGQLDRHGEGPQGRQVRHRHRVRSRGAVRSRR